MRGASRRLGMAVLVAFVLSACASEVRVQEGNERTVYVAAIEPKGSASIDREPFPDEPLPGGGGYALQEPDEDGMWSVETYRWLPGTIVVEEGDRVTLEILGVNGAVHEAFIEGYDVSFEVRRGELTTVDFTADRPGIFRYVCVTHAPAMTGDLVVLPA